MKTNLKAISALLFLAISGASGIASAEVYSSSRGPYIADRSSINTVTAWKGTAYRRYLHVGDVLYCDKAGTISCAYSKSYTYTRAVTYALNAKATTIIGDITAGIQYTTSYADASTYTKTFNGGYSVRGVIYNVRQNADATVKNTLKYSHYTRTCSLYGCYYQYYYNRDANTAFTWNGDPVKQAKVNSFNTWSGNVADPNSYTYDR